MQQELTLNPPRLPLPKSRFVGTNTESAEVEISTLRRLLENTPSQAEEDRRLPSILAEGTSFAMPRTARIVSTGVVGIPVAAGMLVNAGMPAGIGAASALTEAIRTYVSMFTNRTIDSPIESRLRRGETAESIAVATVNSIRLERDVRNLATDLMEASVDAVATRDTSELAKVVHRWAARSGEPQDRLAAAAGAYSGEFWDTVLTSVEESSRQ